MPQPVFSCGVPALDRRLSRRVLPFACRQHHLAHLTRLDRCAEFMRRRVGEGAVEGTDGRKAAMAMTIDGMFIVVSSIIPKSRQRNGSNLSAKNRQA